MPISTCKCLGRTPVPACRATEGADANADSRPRGDRVVAGGHPRALLSVTQWLLQLGQKYSVELSHREWGSGVRGVKQKWVFYPRGHPTGQWNVLWEHENFCLFPRFVGQLSPLEPANRARAGASRATPQGTSSIFIILPLPFFHITFSDHSVVVIIRSEIVGSLTNYLLLKVYLSGQASAQSWCPLPCGRPRMGSKDPPT